MRAMVSQGSSWQRLGLWIPIGLDLWSLLWYPPGPLLPRSVPRTLNDAPTPSTSPKTRKEAEAPVSSESCWTPGMMPYLVPLKMLSLFIMTKYMQPEIDHSCFEYAIQNLQLLISFIPQVLGWMAMISIGTVLSTQNPGPLLGLKLTYFDSIPRLFRCACTLKLKWHWFKVLRLEWEFFFLFACLFAFCYFGMQVFQH